MKATKQSGAPQICMRIIRAHLLRFFVSQGQPRGLHFHPVSVLATLCISGASLMEGAADLALVGAVGLVTHVISGVSEEDLGDADPSCGHVSRRKRGGQEVELSPRVRGLRSRL